MFFFWLVTTLYLITKITEMSFPADVLQNPVLNAKSFGLSFKYLP